MLGARVPAKLFEYNIYIIFAFCTLGVWGKSVFAREREREMFKKEQGHQIHSVK